MFESDLGQASTLVRPRVWALHVADISRTLPLLASLPEGDIRDDSVPVDLVNRRVFVKRIAHELDVVGVQRLSHLCENRVRVEGA